MAKNYKFGYNLRYMEFSSIDDGYSIYSVFGEDSNCDLGGSHGNPFLGNVEGDFQGVLEYDLIKTTTNARWNRYKFTDYFMDIRELRKEKLKKIDSFR